MQKEYTYLYATMSLCNECLKQIPAKIVTDGEKVYLIKYCPEHKEQVILYEDCLDYQLKKPLYDKPSTKTLVSTDIKNGCPFDCGLCPSHEQHTCIGLIEVTDYCDINCPMCYASSDLSGSFLSLAKIEQMIDFYISSENGKAEILQISGGEPAFHPDIIEIIRLSKSKGVTRVMLNTNGIRIAEDIEFVKELSQFISGFEIYLQFDSLKDDVYLKLRNKKLLDIKLKAIENLSRYNIPVTLVVTADSSNIGELGHLINFGLNASCVRGINIQPVAHYGRFNKAEIAPITLSGVLAEIEKQTNSIIKSDDFIPLPCNVERVAVTYLYRKGKDFLSLTRNRNINKYVPYINNTFLFTVNDAIADGDAPIFGCCKALDFLKDFARVIPKGFLKWDKEKRVKYLNENTFRITVTSFVDRYNFDIKSMQKECVHIITEDLKRIPFSAYNIAHRKAVKVYEH